MKTKIKKSIAVIFAVAVVVTFSACKEKDSAMTSWSTDGGHLAGTGAGPWEAGTVENNVYTSKFAGLKIEPNGGDWIFASDDEISNFKSAMVKRGGNTYEETKNIFAASRSTIYDMLLICTTDGSNIILMYQNLNDTFGGKAITSEQYLTEVVKQYQGMRDRYASVSEVKKETYVGQVFSKVEAVSTPALGSAKQTLYVRRIGDYMLCINYTGIEGNQMQTMLNFVKPLS